MLTHCRRPARLLLALIIGPIVASGQSMLRFRVVSGTGAPLSGAALTMSVDTGNGLRIQRSASTDSQGYVTLQGLPPRAHAHVRVRSLGFAPLDRELDLGAAGDKVLELNMKTYAEYSRIRDSLSAVDHAVRVAAARKRGRHWTCRHSRADALRDALAAYRYFVSMSASRNERRMPKDSAAFVTQFTSPITARECRAIGEGLDREVGLASDTLDVYRFGTEFYFRRYGDAGGMFTTPAGKITTVFVIQS